MRVFNSIQMVVLFAVWPFITDLVKQAEFTGNSILFWIMIVTYCVGFVCLIIAVRVAIDKGWD